MVQEGGCAQSMSSELPNLRVWVGVEEDSSSDEARGMLM